ncbi:MAG: hypothetical protein IAG13_29675 [Deltaproteobacteria bacterium]|nr:hypothetical protein [Nannocystaceae bacterium]
MNAAKQHSERSRASGLSIHEAVGHALRAHGPTRLHHDDGETMAEIFVHRGYVIHAHVNGLVGVPAIAAMLGANLDLDVEYEAWPSRCTLLATWDALCREADHHRSRVLHAPPRDDDATARI